MGACGSTENKNKIIIDSKLNVEDSRYRRNENLSYKVVLLGDVFVGKTSILSSIQRIGTDSNYSPTIGFAFSQKAIVLKNGVLLLDFG